MKRRGSLRALNRIGILSWLFVFWGPTVSLVAQDNGSEMGAVLAEREAGKSEIREDSDSDERPRIDATFFIGSAIDNFAADEVSRYLNPEASGEPQQFERLTAGITFAARVGEFNNNRQLWIYGGTVHGVRSSDVNCEENSNLAVCEGFEDETNPGERFLFVLRNASSLEAHLGIRYEFLPLPLGASGDRPMSLFLSAQAGLLSVSGSGSDVIDQNHVGLGVVATRGRFQGSYLEFGHGQSDLFEVNPNKRWKFNGLVDWGLGENVSAFAKITVDVDLKDGADSIQTYLGLRFALKNLFPSRYEAAKAAAAANAGDSSEMGAGSG